MLTGLLKKLRRIALRPVLEHLERSEKAIEKILLANFLSEVEFRIFSQWGEDGIIQYLLSKIEIPRKIFIEFGVEDYRESNTRFLLMSNKWTGLIMDGNISNVTAIQHSNLYWRHTFSAKHAFVTRENINPLLLESDIEGDLDGNDYWVWEKIDVISPRIVICEYNSLWGVKHAVTTPYSSDFQRSKAHYSNLYFGASLQALCLLGRKKGYTFVGCCSAGNNAFFVRNDVALPFLNLKAEFIASCARESRDEQGNLTYLKRDDQLRLLSSLPLWNLESNCMGCVNDLDMP
jgi:hypothetical protein